MSEEPPEPPQISDDGKFYWNGERWVQLVSASGSSTGRVIGIAVVTTLVLAGIIAIAVVVIQNQGHMLTGSLTLHEDVGVAQSCTGTGGYSDIHAGTEVVVKDEGGKVLATSTLSEGVVSAGTCVFSFSIPKVPDAAFYQIEISHRGAVTYSKADMETYHWTIGLDLGG